MLFGRLFGKRRDEEDEEPSAHAAPPAGRVAQPRPKPEPQAQEKPDAQGFDPYNSGAFQRSNAWERVNRR